MVGRREGGCLETHELLRLAVSLFCAGASKAAATLRRPRADVLPLAQTLSPTSPAASQLLSQKSGARIDF